MNYSYDANNQLIQVTDPTGPRINYSYDDMGNVTNVAVTGAVVATLATPAITPAGGTFTNSVKVTLTCTSAGVTIHYTLDDTVPNIGSALYKKTGIIITNNVTLEAKAFQGANFSKSATAMFTIVVPPPPTLATTNLPPATVKQHYNMPHQLQAGTGFGTLKWSLAPKSKLPSGLTLNAKTGVLSGTPKNPTTTPASFTVIVTDARKKSGKQMLALTVN